MRSRSNLVRALLAALALSSAAAADPVELGQRGWQELQAGQVEEAARTFTGMLTTNADPLARAGDLMARRWLTRLDREKVKAALRAAYNRAIAYPAKLTGIEPATDRWGQPWVYELTAPRYITGLTAQSYRLESAALGGESDLAAALRRPYGARITLQPVSISGNIITFAQQGRPQPVVLSPGGAHDGVIFAGLTATHVILSDGDHWKLVARPK